MDPARFFDAIAARYERAYALPSGESRRRMTAVLGDLPPPPARVLDLGVGTGRELPALLDAGHVPTGLDVSREMLERCSRRARPIALVQADFWKPLPLPDASFDAALALHGTLAHPPDGGAMERLGQELARVVRGRGVFVVEAPSPAWLDGIDSLQAPGDARIRRIGRQTFVYTEPATGLSIEGCVLSDEQWRCALGPAWSVRVRPLALLEWVVVARRA